MGIRQLPSRAFQVRFQHHHTAHAATYPTRALAEEAEPLLRAELMDMILADVIEQHVVPASPHDEVLTTSQAAVLLGISRPTLVAWLEAGRLPFHWCGSHRRVTRSDVLAYLDELP